jgi:uncharacterized protein
MMVHGRPAYRVGPHRLYVDLARAWAANGYSVMRLDYRGSGDCEGKVPVFEETVQDIRAGLDAYLAKVPGLEEVIIFGLCSGAADSMNYVCSDPRVRALALLNPWAYSERDRARTRILYYSRLYLRKMRNPDWWRQLGRAESGAGVKLRELFRTAGEIVGLRRTVPNARDTATSVATEDVKSMYFSYRTGDMAQRLGERIKQYPGKLLLILCGEDVNAQSFRTMAESNPVWKKILADRRLTRHDLPGADHGLRRPEWRSQVIQWSSDWLAQL